MALSDSPLTSALRDGRYEGASDHVLLDLRLDTTGANAASADIFRLGPGKRQDWVASVRSTPGTEVADAPGPWPVVAEDDIGGHTTGRLQVTPGDGSEDALHALLVLDAPLNGLPARTEIAVETTRQPTALRSLRIEIESEQGISAPVAYDFRDREVTIDSCLEDAGFSVGRTGVASTAPPAPSGGWDISQLHTLMRDFAQASLGARAWELHLMLLSRATEKGLLGVMFDTTEVLPRQGAAVFADSIRDFAGDNYDRKLIQTSVHELGHALNLAHRFERVVGRADSTSFMNYDWRYLGGEREHEFWDQFAFTFDPDELSFLRHAPRSAVIPGGAAFHSVRYWNEGTGGYSAYVPEVQLDDLQLELRPPGNGRLFSFAQPVFLEVRLTNLAEQAIDFRPYLLDPKAGFLEILIRKTGGVSTRSLADAESFSPIMQRCVHASPATADSVAPKQSIANNVNLTYGSSGFAFAEPGAYEVTALLSFVDQQRGRDFIVRSRPLPIRIAAPMQIEEERDAMDLFRDDVGVYLALGGNRNLETAHDKLAAIVERRGGDMAESDRRHDRARSGPGRHPRVRAQGRRQGLQSPGGQAGPRGEPARPARRRCALGLRPHHGGADAQAGGQLRKLALVRGVRGVRGGARGEDGCPAAAHHAPRRARQQQPRRRGEEVAARHVALRMPPGPASTIASAATSGVETAQRVRRRARSSAAGKPSVSTKPGSTRPTWTPLARSSR